MDIDEIMALLPHRPPFLMLDRVLELEPGERIVALKLVSVNEPWVPGHFPGQPIMPGVLIVEALTQAAAVLALSASEEHRGEPVYLVSLDRVRFRRPVRPGDALRLEVALTDQRRGFLGFRAEATVDGQRAASGSFRATGHSA